MIEVILMVMELLITLVVQHNQFVEVLQLKTLDLTYLEQLQDFQFLL